MGQVHNINGFNIKQADNGHVLIYDERDGKMILSVSCTKPLSERDITSLVNVLNTFIEKEMKTDDI